MTPQCGLCDTEIEAGYLCQGDTLALAGRLERLPILSGRLSISLMPVARGLTERVSSGHAGPSLPVNEAALELWYGGMATVLEKWRIDIQAWKRWGRPELKVNVDQRIIDACRWISMNLEWLAIEYPAAGDLAREVRQLEGAALSVLGERPDGDRGRRIGQCVAAFPDGSVCGAVLRHRPQETRLVCPWCQCVYEARDFANLAALQPEGP
ncbi:hypothetical protein [Actinacidiphila glaucinigra]|uniref:hypothetical protein n=1 Tax=Actinacidiphila glaucinigra TaxID=235986 RepID=UPI0035D7A4E3